MLIGDPSRFAIESAITYGYERLSFRGLGYFVAHIGGRPFGAHQPDATMLALPLDLVGKCISRRGLHTAPFSSSSAGILIEAIWDAVYRPDPQADHYFGLPAEDFTSLVHSSGCDWGSAMDEAFDDGSKIYQFDIGDEVRIIADNNHREPFDWRHDPASLRDIRLPADEFYGVLTRWRDDFLMEWEKMVKIPERDEGNWSPTRSL